MIAASRHIEVTGASPFQNMKFWLFVIERAGQIAQTERISSRIFKHYKARAFINRQLFAIIISQMNAIKFQEVLQFLKTTCSHPEFPITNISWTNRSRNPDN